MRRFMLAALALAAVSAAPVFAFNPDELNKMAPELRRDAFCGKLSVCNNLTQYGIKFSLTSQHTMDPTSPEFLSDLRQFASICRVVKGFILYIYTVFLNMARGAPLPSGHPATPPLVTPASRLRDAAQWAPD